MSLDFTDDQSSLVQVMAWCRQATSHYLSHGATYYITPCLSQCWPRSLSPYVVTRPQWVNTLLMTWRRKEPRHQQLWFRPSNHGIVWPQHQMGITVTSQWARWRLDCVLNDLFRRRWEKTSKFRVTDLCEGEFTGDQSLIIQLCWKII